ncbi:MAG TPA: hypothetical protein DDX98_06545 [Bacteroidales bacterium]|jgi:hydrogenase maturation protease|nr:hypothetical protein [Bacteroidales bacterium]
MSTSQKILVMGMGNDILSDDGIGIRLLRDLQQRIKEPDVEFKEVFESGMQVLELMDGYTKAIILDGIKTGHHPPATIYHFTPDNFKDTLHLTSFHNITFRSSNRIAERLGIKVPVQVHILAVEIVESELFSTKLSHEIEPFYTKIRHDILKIIEKLLHNKVVKKEPDSHGNWL